MNGATFDTMLNLVETDCLWILAVSASGWPTPLTLTRLRYKSGNWKPLKNIILQKPRIGVEGHRPGNVDCNFPQNPIKNLYQWRINAIVWIFLDACVKINLTLLTEECVASVANGAVWSSCGISPRDCCPTTFELYKNSETAYAVHWVKTRRIEKVPFSNR